MISPSRAANSKTNIGIGGTTTSDSDAMEGLAREAGIHAVVPKYQASTHLMPTVHALFSGPAVSPEGRAAIA